MIKRRYFIAVTKSHNDGTGSYSYHSCIMERRSVFPVPVNVYEEMVDHAKEQMKDKPGSGVEIIAFNRI